MTEFKTGGWSAINALLRPHRVEVAGLSLASVTGGIAEASFLVVATHSALALAAGDSDYTIAGVELSVRSSLWTCGVLIGVRLVAALIGVVISARITSSVIAELRIRLSR